MHSSGAKTPQSYSRGLEKLAQLQNSHYTAIRKTLKKSEYQYDLSRWRPLLYYVLEVFPFPFSFPYFLSPFPLPFSLSSLSSFSLLLLSPFSLSPSPSPPYFYHFYSFEGSLCLPSFPFIFFPLFHFTSFLFVMLEIRNRISWMRK